MRRRAFSGGIAAAIAAPSARAETLVKHRLPDGEDFRLADIIGPRQTEASHAVLDGYSKEFARFLDLPDLSARDVLNRDRWDRRVVVLHAADETILQNRLIEKGLARVAPESEAHENILHLLQLEKGARNAGRGLWADSRMRIRDALSASDAVGSFNLVEGVTKSGAIRKGRAYLNFGDDFRTDFTATAPSRSARKWRKSGLDFDAAAGRRVRIRGYVSRINGPSIEILHRLQAELL